MPLKTSTYKTAFISEEDFLPCVKLSSKKSGLCVPLLNNFTDLRDYWYQELLESWIKQDLIGKHKLLSDPSSFGAVFQMLTEVNWYKLDRSYFCCGLPAASDPNPNDPN